MPRTVRVQVGSVAVPSRRLLVHPEVPLDSDKPGPDNTGPYSVQTFQDVYPPAGSNIINISTTTPQVGKRYWGCVNPTVVGWRLEQCILAGPDPMSFGAAPDGDGSPDNMGAIQNFGTTPEYGEMWDCLIDQSLWLTPAAPIQRSKLSPHQFGIHGGNMGVYRTEIVNCGDGWNLIGPNGSDLTAVANQSNILQQSWLHKGYYQNDVRSVSDGQNHADGLQNNWSDHVLIYANTIGGDRDVVGYNTWPGASAGPDASEIIDGPGYNSGDDFAYAGIMMTTETTNSDLHPSDPDGWIIEYNWLGGAIATINVVVERGNDWSGCRIRYNKFLRRGADWGKKSKAMATADPVDPVNKPGGWVPFIATGPAIGYYFTSLAGFAGTITGNVFEDDETPVPGGG